MNPLGLMWVKAAWTPTTASCREVRRALQSYLDDEVDEAARRRIGRHLHLCRRCGMDAATYRQLKEALLRQSGRVDPRSAERLRAFAADLTTRPTSPAETL